MPALRIVTWNVLHHVHAKNWDETPLRAFPDEATRVAAIADRVAHHLLAHGASVVCLQEVSGDQLAALRRALGHAFDLVDHTYPRVPRVHGGGRTLLADPTEHLVSIATPARTRSRGARTFIDDPGKGFLAIDVDGTPVFNVHISYGDRGAGQMALVAEAARATRLAAVVAGDFNAPRDVVRAALGAAAVLSDVAGQRATRVATSERAGRAIDHVAVFGGVIEGSTVFDGEGLSDHNPVGADLTFAGRPAGAAPALA